MGTCIICGTSVEGHICQSHQEDVLFEFAGESADDLASGRFYRGTVDGYADFGVFVDIGDAVTGLLHRSELDTRLESLEWEPGDEVIVQVLDVKDNGNVDLGWSIRERAREFRGQLVQTPEGEVLPEETDDPVANDGGATTSAEPSPDTESDEPEASEPVTPAPEESPPEETEAEPEPEPIEPAAQLERTKIEAISEYVGSVVRLEGEITGVRQTSGPTVFELTDETASVECAAFEDAGVRAYPEVEGGDLVALIGEVEHHHGDLQVETERLEKLTGEDADAVRSRRQEALEAAAEPADVSLLADHEPVTAVEEDIVAAATAIRRAVNEARPIVVRHRQTADGYVAGAALERAILPLLRENHTRDDAEYHYFERRPIEGPVYGMDEATDDVSSMLESRDRFGEQLPLVVLVDAGGTADSVEGYELLDVYGADVLVVDDCTADAAVTEVTEAAVLPTLTDADGETVTTTALAANVAAHVNPDVRTDLEHLPAVSFWSDVPPAYLALATEAGYDGAAIAERREAIALEAYYQSYKDKRELVADLLFGDADGLVGHVSEQFRTKLEDELATARANLVTEERGDVAIGILESDAFTHQYDFPPTALLLEALHRERREDTEQPVVTLALDDDTLRVRSTEPIDVREIGAAVEERAPEAGLQVVGGADGRLSFLQGERAAVREAVLGTLEAELAPEGRHA